MRKEIIEYLSKNNDVKYIFTDYFDTIVHRTVHPNYVLRLWAKKMIEQLDISLSVDELYFTRNQSTMYLSDKLDTFCGEFTYEILIHDIYTRLENNRVLGLCDSYEYFLKISEGAEFYAENTTQFLNTETVETLKHLKKEGYKVYCVSDFYTNESILKQLIEAHGLSHTFDDVFVSAARGCSKHIGGIYPYLLDLLDIKGEQTIMIGDNYESDVINAEKNNIKAFYIPNKEEKDKQKKIVFGNDNEDYSKLVKSLYKQCNTKEAPPHSDYIIMLGYFTEKLYQESLSKRTKDLFFLAREGYYLKKLFDFYQSVHHIKNGHFINTHYLKVSRKSTMQIGLKSAEQEDFDYFKNTYRDYTIQNFLGNFSMTDDERNEIIEDCGFSDIKDDRITYFMDSDAFKTLKSNKLFIKYYDKNRNTQRDAFKNYLDSFGVDYKNEGLNIVDIGWKCTIQNALHNYFEKQVKINGYYLGLKDLMHDSTSSSYNNYKRGLNFETNLFDNYKATIMMANTDFYENLCQAPHGTTVKYVNDSKDYAVLKHMEFEKTAYEKIIKPTQDFMLNIFKIYCTKSQNICFTPEYAEELITDYALKLNTLISKRKLQRANELFEGFYDNFGNNDKGGSSYELNVSKGLKKKLSKIKNIMIAPENIVFYAYRTKLSLYSQKKLFVPTFPLYYYVTFNRYAKRLISKRCHLKFTHFR